MHLDTGLLAVVGSLCMMLALGLAWGLAAVRSSRLVKRCLPNPQYSLKAHHQTAAQTSRQLIRDVVHAVRSSAPLEKSQNAEIKESLCHT